MWTAKTRGRIAAIEKKTKRYPTDLTDAEWGRIRPLLPRPAKRGRKPSVDLREILNAIRYMTRTGGGWRMLPKDFPPWQTVYCWFRRFVRLLLFHTIHDIALMVDRERAGRTVPSPPRAPTRRTRHPWYWRAARPAPPGSPNRSPPRGRGTLARSECRLCRPPRPGSVAR